MHNVWLDFQRHPFNFLWVSRHGQAYAGRPAADRVGQSASPREGKLPLDEAVLSCHKSNVVDSQLDRAQGL